MKHIRIVLPVVLLVLSSMAFSQSSESHDFRDFDWGDSVDSVKARETWPILTEDTNALVFSGEVSGKEAAAVYNFLPTGLSMAGYVFQDSYTNENQYIEDFNDINSTLTRIYGVPDFDDVNWSNDLYKDDPSRYGFAVSLGHVVYQAQWTTDATVIRHTLHGNNYEIDHGVVYNSIDLQDDVEQQENESEDDAF